MYYFCAETGGFYLSEEEAPSSCVEVSDEEHERLFDEQGRGAIIQADAEGKPIAVMPEKSPDTHRSAIDVDTARQKAYATEADPLFFKAQRGEASMEEWKAKVDEIKARYPAGELPQAQGDQGDQAEQHANETTTDAP